MQKNIRYFYHHYLKSRRWPIAFIIFLLLASQFLSNAGPYFYKLIVDKLTLYLSGGLAVEILVKGITFLIVLLFFLHLARLGLQALRMYLTNVLEAQTMKQVAADFVKHILNLSFHFHAHRKTGELAKRFARGINAVEEFMDDFIFNLFPNLFELLIILTIYFIFDWPSGLILLLVIIAFIAATVLLNNWQQQYRRLANEIEDQANRKAIDAFMNAEAVKYFNQEDYEFKSYDKINSRWQRAQLRFWNRYVLIEFVQSFITTVGALAIIIFSVSRVINHSFTLGSLVMMITYLQRVYFPLFSFQHVYRRLRTSLTDLDSIFRYFSLSNEIKDLPAAKDLQVTEGKIEFKNVGFAYEDAKQVIKDVSFYVPGGKSLAIVGPSGVGKSTLIKLLYRFYDLTSGQILIDGQDISQVKQESVRRHLVIVPQETALFNETLAYNIAYGKPNAEAAEIKRAVKFSRIANFIKTLTDGYKTLVGERGIRLSGGEKQRVSIARAVLAQAPVLILDEATSSLDSAVEREIQESLAELIKEKTSIIIAHRLSTVMRADFIVVLENGTVAQAGTHEQLLQKGGLYQKLWELQVGGYIK